MMENTKTKKPFFYGWIIVVACMLIQAVPYGIATNVQPQFINFVTSAVGTTSYGKGLVQSVREFNDGTGYKLTTAQYYTPNGNYINKQGIKPNIVEKNKEKQLDRAIEYIKKNK